MAVFSRYRRHLTAWLVLAAMVFAHSALAVAACIAHAETGQRTAAHEHGAGAMGHTHEGDSSSLLCQIGCEAQAQARVAPNTLEEPAPVAYKVAVLTPIIVGLVWPTLPVEAPSFYVSAAPPPLPLTILLSRFQK